MNRSAAFRRILTTTCRARNPTTLPGLRERLGMSSVPTSHKIPSRRAFTTSTVRRDARTPSNEEPAPPRSQPEEPISEDRWIGVLENTASAPWLAVLPTEHGDRLKRAYTLLFQIVLYLGRPQEGDKAEQFLMAFGTAPVSQDSEIGRARKAVATIARGVVRDISSIPANSPLRTEQAEVFNIFGALQALHDMYLVDAEVDDWGEFWGRAQPVVLSLGMKLDEVGFGLNLDEFEKSEREKDEKMKKDGGESTKET